MAIGSMRNTVVQRTNSSQGPHANLLRAVAIRHDLRPRRPQVSSGEAATSASPEGYSGACPVLKALKEIPEQPTPFFPVLRDILSPNEYAEEVLQGRPAARANWLWDSYATFTGLDALKAVWAAESQGAIRQMSDDADFKELFGEEALLSAHGEKHTFLRRLLSPAFTPEQAVAAAPLISDISRRYLQLWAKAGRVNAARQLKLATFEVICNVLLGLDFNDKELDMYEKDFEDYVAGMVALPFPATVPFSPRWKSVRGRARLVKVCEQRLESMRRDIESGADLGSRVGSTLHTMALGTAQGERLTTVQATDNLILLMFAGHDTSANALSNLLYQLTKAPSVVAALREEQACVVAAHGEAFTSQALKSMPYLDHVLQENLRIIPIVSFTTRRAISETEVLGYRVPARSLILLPLGHDMLHDPRWDPRDPTLPAELHPDTFNPARWTSPRAKQPGGTYVPFGGGMHVCLGANLAITEMRVFVSELVRGFEFESQTNVEFDRMPLARPKGGVLMTKFSVRA